MAHPPVTNRVRAGRERLALTQNALAERIGVSRQTILAVESGRHVPSTALALALARVLRCAVEDLFRLEAPDDLTVEVPSSPVAVRPMDGAQSGLRVALGQVADRWIAHPISADVARAADGILAPPSKDVQWTARPLADVESLQRNVLVAGCAPLIGTLAHRVAARFNDARVTWIPASSGTALELLAGGYVHAAGLHLADPTTGIDNVAVVRERFPHRAMHVVNLTQWRQGLVVAPDNPAGIEGAADLLRPEVRLVQREPGAGAHRLVARTLAQLGSTSHAPTGPLASGHLEVAQLIRHGVADVGVAIESVAVGAGLQFVPLVEERFDLVFPVDLADTPPISRVIDMLRLPAFRTEAELLRGYNCERAGDVTTLDAA